MKKEIEEIRERASKAESYEYINRMYEILDRNKRFAIFAKADIFTLLYEVDRLRKGLEFFANPKNYNIPGTISVAALSDVFIHGVQKAQDLLEGK